MKKLNSTPKIDNFTIYADFQQKDVIWILWPERDDNWRLNAEPAQKSFANLANLMTKYTKVKVGVIEKDLKKAIRLLEPDVDIHLVNYNDSWIRDNGPIFLKNSKGEVRASKFAFNAWGGEINGLYSDWSLDQTVPEQICKIEEIDYYESKMVLEGGSVISDGEGTLITTEECLLDRGRNSQMSKNEITEELKLFLNVEKVIWLPYGVYNDETKGHVDNVCIFIEPGKVLLNWTEDSSDEQYKRSKANFDILVKAVDAKGRKLEINKILQPQDALKISNDVEDNVKKIAGTKERVEGERLPANYINLLFVNKAIFIPAFGDPNDKLAAKNIADLFPDREIILFPSNEIIYGGGNIHCITNGY